VNPLKTFLRTLTDRAATAYVAGPHLADAIELLVKRTQPSLSEDRDARHAYPQKVAGP